METARHVLLHAAKLAQHRWSNRFVAAYVLGSLAHGGFSVHVSDVDLGLVLADPLDEQDAKEINRLVIGVRGAPLADRLSVFWGSVATLSGTATGGRFPPIDVLDLVRHGRLLCGRDIRSQLPTPTQRELVVSGARFALRRLLTPDVTTQLKLPERLAQADVKTLTKLVLFPVRLLFTARTGRVGMNDEAVDHLLSLENGPAAELARNSLLWRNKPPEAGDRAVAALLQEGALSLYRTFIDDCEQRLRDYGEYELAQAYREWRQQLA